MTKRLLLSLPALLAILFLPYWIYLPLLIAGALILPLYWEGVLLGLLADSLYGPAHIGLTLDFHIALTVLALTLIMIPLRKRLRFHA